MPSGPSYPLQTILLGDLVGCGSLLQKVIGALFFNLKYVKQPLQSAAGSHTQPSKFKLKKSMPTGHSLSAAGFYTRLDGQHSPLKTYHSVFSRAEKPSEDIRQGLFQMNTKGLHSERRPSRAEKPSEDITRGLFSDEYERVRHWEETICSVTDMSFISQTKYLTFTYVYLGHASIFCYFHSKCNAAHSIGNLPK